MLLASSSSCFIERIEINIYLGIARQRLGSDVDAKAVEREWQLGVYTQGHILHRVRDKISFSSLDRSLRGGDIPRVSIYTMFHRRRSITSATEQDDGL